VTYGFREDADVTAADVDMKGFGSTSRVHRRDADGRRVEIGELHLSIPGRHNVLNALAAVAMAGELGVAFIHTARALAAFHGAVRRFQRRGEARGVVVIEDYGHHPTEIAAVIAAARAIVRGRLIVAFQPHRFSRTHALLADFGPAFAGADIVMLTDIYAAGEDPIEGVTMEALANAVATTYQGELHVVGALGHLPHEVTRVARAGDLVVLLGAGSIGSAAGRVLDALNSAGGRVSDASHSAGRQAIPERT
jgi:UDP-N-acetylmuramate--alanine ligase